MPKFLPFIVLLFIGCKTGRYSEVTATASASSVPVELYSIDGSGNSCVYDTQEADSYTLGVGHWSRRKIITPEIDRTTICQLARKYDPKWEKNLYAMGVQDFRFAEDMGFKNRTITKKICRDKKAGKFGEAVLIAYSRGAIQAISIANQVNENCFGTYTKVVKAIGLIDAVATSAWRVGLRKGDPMFRRSIPRGVHALHIHKLPTASYNDRRTLGKFLGEINLYKTLLPFVRRSEAATTTLKTMGIFFQRTHEGSLCITVTDDGNSQKGVIEHGPTHGNMARGLECFDQQTVVQELEEAINLRNRSPPSTSSNKSKKDTFIKNVKTEMERGLLARKLKAKKWGNTSIVFRTLKSFVEMQGVQFPSRENLDLK